MSEAPRSQGSPELVELLQVLVTLFPEHYPDTANWLTQRDAARTANVASSQGDVASGATTSSLAGLSRPNSPPSEDRRNRRWRKQGKTASTSVHRPPSLQPGRAVPGPPSPVWPSTPPEVHRVPSPNLPAAWAGSHGYGLRLQWYEEQELMSTFARKLGFPASRAGRMGTLIMFADAWEAAGGQTKLAVYHPREPSPNLALIDVTRDDAVVAQFEASLPFIDARSIMALLPVEWRRGT